MLPICPSLRKWLNSFRADAKDEDAIDSQRQYCGNKVLHDTVIYYAIRLAAY